MAEVHRLISWAWLAGFTDGDGHIRVVDPRELHGEPTGAWVRIGWTQAQANVSALETIDTFLRVRGIPRIRKRISVARQGRVYPAFELGIGRQDAVYDVLAQLVPHLVLKREAALRGIEILDLIRRATAEHGRRSWLRKLRAA